MRPKTPFFCFCVPERVVEDLDRVLVLDGVLGDVLLRSRRSMEGMAVSIVGDW